jgi:hypothetical protein
VRGKRLLLDVDESRELDSHGVVLLLLVPAEIYHHPLDVSRIQEIP